jgi:hypothetical protein
MILSLYSKPYIVSEFASRLILVTSNTLAKIEYLYRLFPDQRKVLFPQSTLRALF